MAEKPATHTGVEKPTKDKAPPTFYNPRNDYIGQIALQAEKDLESPGDETDDPTLKPDSSGEQDVKEVAQAEKAEDKESEDKEEQVAEPGEKPEDKASEEEKEELQEKSEIEEEQHADLVTIKVDGEERQVPRSQVLEAGVRALQKESAADRRLEEATRLLNEAKQIKPPQSSEEDAKEPPPEEDVAALARAIQVGSAEEAENAIRKLKAMTTLAPGVITNAIDDRIEFRTAADWFRSEYKDIFSDPILVERAGNEDARLLSAGDKRGYRERYKAIGDELRKWKQAIASEQVAIAKKQLEEDLARQKREKKASSTKLPTASVKHEQATAEDEQEESPSDVIANIAKQRGQAYVR